MLEQVQFTFERPSVMSSNMFSAKTRLLLPTWAPEPCPIVGAAIWDQGQLPPDAWGDFSIAVDPGSQYYRESGYPHEATSPILFKSLGVMELQDRRRLKWVYHPHPIMFRRNDGDGIILALEELPGATEFEIALYVSFMWLESYTHDTQSRPPISCRLLLDTRDSVYGVDPVRDHSISNHQLLRTGSLKIDSKSILFDGGYLEVDDHLYDFILDDFELSGEISTQTVLPNPARRHILCTGTGPTACGVGIHENGTLFFGNESTGPTLLGRIVVADGAFHTFVLTRRFGTLSLTIDGISDVVAQDNVQYRPNLTTVRIGRCFYKDSGDFIGSIRKLQLLKFY